MWENICGRKWAVCAPKVILKIWMPKRKMCMKLYIWTIVFLITEHTLAMWLWHLNVNCVRDVSAIVFRLLSCLNNFFWILNIFLAFSQLKYLQSHTKRSHAEQPRVKPYPCMFCGKAFNRKFTMEEHMLRHNKAKRFDCTKCERTFLSETELYKHHR